MIFTVFLIPAVLYSNKLIKNSYCMSFIFRRFSKLYPVTNMTSSSTDPLVGKKLSNEALNVPLVTHLGETTSLKKILEELPKSYKGLVMFLFPSAGTPGCTKQACNFTSSHQSFKDKGYEVYGLTSSERSPAGKWTEKHSLTFTTLVDKDMKLVDHLDCRKMHLFVKRSHLVLSRDGEVLAFEKGVNAGNKNKSTNTPLESSASRVLQLLEAF